MDAFDYLAFILIAISVALLFVMIYSIIRKSRQGKLILKIPDKSSATNVILSFVWMLILTANLFSSSVSKPSMKIMFLFVYGTVAIEFLYLAIARIQLRENGLASNFTITSYNDIIEYKWIKEDQLMITRKKGIMKKIIISIKPAYKGEMEKCLKERIEKNNMAANGG